MTDILLISEDYFKTNSSIDSNIYGKYLMSSIREAQDLCLQTIIGTNLYNTILSMVENSTITDSENKAYKTLLDDFIQPYILYATIVNLMPIISTKIANIGTVITNDEHVVSLSKNERDNLINYYQYRADFYARQMQNYLLKNYSLYKELCTNDIAKIKHNLTSSASCSIWLGGRRNK